MLKFSSLCATSETTRSDPLSGGSPFPIEKRGNARHGADTTCAYVGKGLAARLCRPCEICRTLGCGSRRPPLSATPHAADFRLVRYCTRPPCHQGLLACLLACLEANGTVPRLQSRPRETLRPAQSTQVRIQYQACYNLPLSRARFVDCEPAVLQDVASVIESVGPLRYAIE